MERNIRHIEGTPLSILVYSVESSPTQMNEPGIVEIIFCLKGSVRFSYAYEEFTLHAGDYISVDQDAYFLYKGKDNICVSFYLDMNRYKDQYPDVKHGLFVCEGTPETDVKGYPTPAHMQMKGLMIAALKNILEDPDCSKIPEIADRMADLMLNHFDITFYHYGSQDMPSRDLERTRKIREYIYNNLDRKIEIGDIASEMGLTSSYLSEFMRKKSLGFRGVLSYVRANRSERYLMNTDMTIMEISEECGFSDVKYYYSAFKRWYKCTPRQFRERFCKVTDVEIDYLDVEDAENLVDDLMKKHFMTVFAE